MGCQYAFRSHPMASIRCAAQDGNPFCAFQQHCGKTGKWENTPAAGKCKIKTKK